MNSNSLHWYVLYVKSRHEYVTERELNRKGIETYLPSVKKLSRWKDRKKLIDFPLFPGYLFTHIQSIPEKFLKVLQTKGAVTLLYHKPGYPASVPDEEISSIKILVESGRELDVYPYFKEGSPVRIKRGPLKGAQGILNKKEDYHMFLINVELLGRSVGVNIYAEDVEPL